MYDARSLKNVFISILSRFSGKFDENTKWQDLIKELSKLGLGAVFFDVSVTKNPENIIENIIVVGIINCTPHIK